MSDYIKPPIKQELHPKLKQELKITPREKPEKVRVETPDGELFICFYPRQYGGLFVERISDNGTIKKIKVVSYRKVDVAEELKKNYKVQISSRIFSGIKYERLQTTDGSYFCCRTFAGRRYCKLINHIDLCDGSVFF